MKCIDLGIDRAEVYVFVRVCDVQMEGVVFVYHVLKSFTRVIECHLRFSLKK